MSTMPTKALALPPVAWECANCAHTNEGTEPGPCSGCGAINPIRYMIWKRQGGVLAPSTINARVDRSLQCLLSANTNEQNASAAPRQVDVVASLVGSMVDVVGIHAKNRGPTQLLWQSGCGTDEAEGDKRANGLQGGCGGGCVGCLRC